MFGGTTDRLGRIEDVERERAAREMRPTRLQRLAELLEPESTRLLRSPRCVIDGHGLVAPVAKDDIASERVRVRQKERAFAAVDGETADVLPKRLEADGQRRKSTHGEMENGGDVGRNHDGDRLAGTRARAEDPLSARRGRECGDGSDRTKHRHDCRQVVGRDVKERAAALDVEHLGVRMPELRPAGQYRRRGSERASDRPFPDEPPAGLVGAPQKRVWGTTEAQAACLGSPDQLPRAVDRCGEWLLGVCVLPRGESCADDARMCSRRRQVEDEVDCRIGDQLVDGERP